MSFTFAAFPTPFSRWVGPYSVARGTRSGFRFNKGKLGAWVETRNIRTFWVVTPSPGTISLAQLVKQHWGQGRVLLLPDGLVMKPDPDPNVNCVRFPIGRIQGGLVVAQPNGTCFDLSNTQHLRPGDPWPGPPTTGIECALDATGTLTCEWELAAPQGVGRLRQTITVCGPDPALAKGLQAARPGASSVRVRVQYGGSLITRHEEEATLTARYVGRLDVRRWPFDAKWVVS